MYLSQYKVKKLKKNRKRRVFFVVVGLFAFVFVAVFGLLVLRSPVSLQDAGEIIRSAAIGLSASSLPGEAANDVILRGIIYDRNFQELAVSYQFFSLYARPAKISNYVVALQKLVPLLGKTSEELLELLGKPARVVQLADKLVVAQVEAIRALSLEGLFFRESEERFYPGHTAGVHIVGYISGGIGLAGMEGRFDLLLEPGEYLTSMVPEVDFQGYTVLGRMGTDLVLTMDIGLQRKIDRYLLDIMLELNADQAMGMLLDPWTGRVLSLSSLPSFDANRFWEASEQQRENRVFSQVLSYEMVRPILTRVAAVMQKGLQAQSLLPTTVATIDFGLREEEISRLIGKLCFRGPVYERAGEGVLFGSKLTGHGDEFGNDGLISLAQIGVGVASLINGGWRIAPVFLDSVYDVQENKFFPLSRQAVSRKLVVSPVMGVVLRRHLFSSSEENGMVTFVGRDVRVVPAGMFSNYIQQEFFAGVIRGEGGRSLLLLIAVEQKNLAPFKLQERGKAKKSLKEHGRSLLVDLYLSEHQKKVAVRPLTIDKDNKARFLITGKIQQFPQVTRTKREAVEMPLVIGSSLREGLQALNQYNCRVLIKGSGRIVSQYPLARQRLHEGDECIIQVTGDR